MEVLDFLLQMEFPDFLDGGFGLVRGKGPVQVRFHIVVEQHVFQPRAVGIEQRAVVGDVLFFDHAEVKLTARVVFVGRAHVHVEVHGLLLSRRDDQRGEHGADIRLLEVTGFSHRIERMAMVGDGGAAGGDFDVILGELVSRDIAVEIEQVGVAVEVGEILQQGEVEALLDIGVRLVFGQPCGQVDGKVLIADGLLKLAFVTGAEPVDGFLLHLFHAAGKGDLAPEFLIVAVAVEVVPEHGRFDLNAVHEDNPAFGPRVHLHFVVGFGIELAPVGNGFFDRQGLLFKRIESHSVNLHTVFAWTGTERLGVHKIYVNDFNMLYFC